MAIEHQVLFGVLAEEVRRLKAIKAEETQKAANRQIKRLVQNFGCRPVSEISELAWVEYVERELQKRERKFYDDRKYMRMILLYSQRKKLISEVPPLPIPDVDDPAGREILPDELRRLEDCAGMTLRFQIRIGWKMGLRLREMMRLRWDQFSWEDGGSIFLRAKRVKTRRGREVSIPTDLLPFFKARKDLAESEFVFPNRNGTGPQDHNRTAWRRCKAKAGVKARWHDLRHTCATVMLRRDVPEYVVRLVLGMSERVLKRIYLHLRRDDLRRAAIAMSDPGRLRRAGKRKMVG